MSLKILSLNRNLKSVSILSSRFCSSKEAATKDEVIDISKADVKPVYESDKYTQEEIDKIRCVSRLNPSHRNILHGKPPYQVEMGWTHYTIKYKRRMLARYGLGSIDANPGICWPSKEEIEDMEEYERVKYPQTLTECWAKIKEDREMKETKIRNRELEIETNLQKMDKWKKELASKIAAKEKAIAQAAEKKERLIEEVRQHFGFKVSMKDEKFKLMMEQKEKEERKLNKEAKKKERAAKTLARMLQMEQDAKESLKSQNEGEPKQ